MVRVLPNELDIMSYNVIVVNCVVWGLALSYSKRTPFGQGTPPPPSPRITGPKQFRNWLLKKWSMGPLPNTDNLHCMAITNQFLTDSKIMFCVFGLQRSYVQRSRIVQNSNRKKKIHRRFSMSVRKICKNQTSWDEFLFIYCSTMGPQLITQCLKLGPMDDNEKPTTIVSPRPEALKSQVSSSAEPSSLNNKFTCSLL